MAFSDFYNGLPKRASDERKRFDKNIFYEERNEKDNTEDIHKTVYLLTNLYDLNCVTDSTVEDTFKYLYDHYGIRLTQCSRSEMDLEDLGIQLTRPLSGENFFLLINTVHLFFSLNY